MSYESRTWATAASEYYRQGVEVLLVEDKGFEGHITESKWEREEREEQARRNPPPAVADNALYFED